MIEYRILSGNQIEISEAMNVAAPDGWRYVDTMATYETVSYGMKRIYVVLMSRGEVPR